MANKPAPTAASEPSTSIWNKKTIIILVLAVLVFSSIAAGAIWFLMKPKEGTGEPETTEETIKPAIYVPIAQSLVILIRQPGTDKPAYLQLNAEAVIRDEAGKPILETHVPALTNAILVSLQGLTTEDLAQQDSMLLLQEKATISANERLEEDGKDIEIEGIIFTQFVYQN